MNSQSLGLRVASVVFGLMCLGQLLRIVTRLEIHVGSLYIHRWVSAVIVIITGFLCLWLWMLSTRVDKPAVKPDAQAGKP